MLSRMGHGPSDQMFCGSASHVALSLASTSEVTPARSVHSRLPRAMHDPSTSVLQLPGSSMGFAGCTAHTVRTLSHRTQRKPPRHCESLWQGIMHVRPWLV